MPTVTLPLAKGLVTSNQEADWLDSIPTNMLAVPKAVLGSNGYMRSWPGLNQSFVSSGVSRGGVYNFLDNQIYRVQGTGLIDGAGRVLTNVGGSGLAQMPFSPTSQAIVSNGKLLYWRDNQLTELRNWSEGEKFSGTPDNRWTPDYRGDQHVTIPEFNPQSGFRITFTVFLSDITAKQWIVGSNTVESGGDTPEAGVHVEGGVIYLQLTNGTRTHVQNAVSGVNLVSISSSSVFESAPAVIGGIVTNNSPKERLISGEIYNVEMTDLSATPDSRNYESIISLPSGEGAPTTTVLTDSTNSRHGTLVGFGSDLWKVSQSTPAASPSSATTYDISNIVDAVRNRGRYIFIQEGKGTFGVTDIENEQRPDFIAPFYSAEASPDENMAVDAWRGYVVVFGRFTIEYFTLTGNANQIYQPQQSLAIRAGIVGRGCKAQFLDSFAILGGPRFESPSIYIVAQGQYQEIATRRIQKYLREYSDAELSTAYLEPVKFDHHDMLLVHLPRHTLVYDHSGSADGIPKWTRLKTDISGDLTYRGKYHIFDGDKWTVGDKRDGTVSVFDFESSQHVGSDVEFILDSPMVQARNQRVFDLEVDNIPGRKDVTTNISVSATYDGITHTQEYWQEFSVPQDYRRRVLLRRLGYSKNNIGFRLRWTTSAPTTISNLRVRFE